MVCHGSNRKRYFVFVHKYNPSLHGGSTTRRWPSFCDAAAAFFSRSITLNPKAPWLVPRSEFFLSRFEDCMLLYVTVVEYGAAWCNPFWEGFYIPNHPLSQFFCSSSAIFWQYSQHSADYSLVPIRRHVPINSHTSRHGTCNVPYRSYISMLQKV